MSEFGGQDAVRGDRADEGETVCWLERVCPACGRLNDRPGARCEACGNEDW
ncbi:MAG: hypothetical protein M3P96_14335 [Actinomycetota bacterium]|nr:hypothetical protein [Actinomycetota bacterium]